MKTLITKITQALALTLLALPAVSHAGLSVQNNTQHIVKAAIYQGDVAIAKCFGMLPGQSYLPGNSALELTATTLIKGNTYLSQSLTIDPRKSSDYSAIIHARGGQQDFALEESEASTIGALNLNNTLSVETQFTIKAQGNVIQSIVVPANTTRTLSFAPVYKVIVVVDGITLDPVITENSNTNFQVNASVDRNGAEVYEVQQ